MEQQPFNEAMAEQVLAHDPHSLRFEAFCVDLYSEVDSVDYLPTSKSWDLGVDGRTTGLTLKDPPLLAASLRGDVSTKVLEDLERLFENNSITTLRFCSSQRLSEHALNGIKRELTTKYPGITTFRGDGSIQIAALCARHDACGRIFQKHYKADLDSLRDILATSTSKSDESRVTGMRIALTTQLTSTGDSLRSDVIRNLVLMSLQDKRRRSKTMIAKLVSDGLHLGRIVHDLYLEATIKQLMKDEYTSKTGELFTITDKGFDYLSELTDRGVKKWYEGKDLVRQAIEKLTGRPTADGDFEKVWKLLQDELSTMFFENGMQIIEAIGSIARDNAVVKDFKDLSAAIVALGKRVEGILFGGPIAQDIGQAITDMFHDKTLPTFEWLTTLCACYVTVCSLGLEPASQEAIFARLKSIDLILDTDILLSLLAEGEPDHDTVNSVVAAWRKLGGTVSVAIPVLEEAAHHAFISENDFNEVFHQMGKYTTDDALIYITNAFVRGYWAAARKKGKGFSKSTFRQYIANFRGRKEEDYAHILDELSASHIGMLSEEGTDKSLAKGVSDAMTKDYRNQCEKRGEQVDFHVTGKADRDGRLIATLAAQRKARQALHRSSVIISSAAALKNACKQRAELEGIGEAVMPLGAVAYLLSLAPGAQISLFSLKKLMFNPGSADRLSPLQRVAMRIIYESSEYSLPFSRRLALQRQMNMKIKEIAVQRGESIDAVQEKLVRRGPERDELVKEVVHDALDQLSISSSERRIQELERENARLQAELRKRKTSPREKKPKG